MRNTVIVPYRHRPERLPLFLEALNNCQHPELCHLLIVEQADPDEITATRNLISPPKKIPTEILTIQKPGAFHRSLLLNAGAKAAQTELVTFVDVDRLATSNLLDLISQFYDDPDHQNTKLGYRVRHLTTNGARKIISDGLNYWRTHCLPYPNQFPNCFYESTGDRQTGNSHCTIRRDLFLQLGGYDERFIGYGLEDHCFNNRCYNVLGSTPILDGGEFWHLYHPPSSNNNDRQQEANLQLYLQKKHRGFPPLPRITL